MAEIEKLEDSRLEDVAGGYSGQRWAVRCGSCGYTHQVCSDKLQADGVNNSLIINGRLCPRCGKKSWFVTPA